MYDLNCGHDKALKLLADLDTSSKIEKHAELFGDDTSLTQVGRELGIRRLMAINLMKRMESSVYSFNLTLTRIKDQIERTIQTINDFDKMASMEISLYYLFDYYCYSIAVFLGWYFIHSLWCDDSWLLIFLC